MIDTQDLRFFATIAQAPSLAAAARQLNVSPPAVSQRLQALEERLSLRLVERSGRGLRLTAEGEILYHRSKGILETLQDLRDDLSERRDMAVGTLRVVAPLGFGRAHIAGEMAALRRHHPAVSLSLTLSDAPYHAIRQDSWDVLIHIGSLPDSGLTQRKLAGNRRILCAAPSYLAQIDPSQGPTQGPPQGPTDLRHLDCGVIRENDADTTLWSFRNRESETEAVRIHPSFESNDGTVIRDWALAGLGIVERSEWDVAADLDAGRLVEILPGWTLPDADITALLGPRHQRTARVELFLEALITAFDPPPWRRSSRTGPDHGSRSSDTGKTT